MKYTHYTRHHMVPRSRGGSDCPSNIKICTKLIHDAWHSLFKNMTPEEVVALLTSDQFQFDYENGKWRAWKIVFGSSTGRLEAALIVQEDWTPQ